MIDLYEWLQKEENESVWYPGNDPGSQLEAEEEKERREHKIFDLAR